MNLAASASFRAAAELGDPDWDDETERELPDGYESWDEYYNDQLDGPTDADYAALDRAYAARDAEERSAFLGGLFQAIEDAGAQPITLPIADQA